MIPDDYTERTYAGVLGKLIGVYLGRPFEGWLYDQIMAELGEITYYVHEKRGVPLIVADDDISGTFTFLRAMPDYGNSRDLTPQQIGQTWLNYIIENRTILWWGGLGNSTEHTAYLRLKGGVPAPSSGSMSLNTKTVAEQIGAQIFIDGWGMVAPGDPELAANLAQRAASVSHDGEAIYGAQVIAAMEALAYVETDLNKLIDAAVRLIPNHAIIYRLIADLREWHSKIPDWRAARLKVVETYGYDRYGGNCHIVPNHALVILALLYGEDQFQKSLMIVNTAGWDTDCNSGNVGCLLGIKNGLAGIGNKPDWRTPIADRLYLPSADGGRTITDAVTETYHIVNIGYALHSMPPLHPKNNSRFHFELPGSVQGFAVDGDSSLVIGIKNIEGHSQLGKRSLAIHYSQVTSEKSASVATLTFIPPEAIDAPGYGLHASPTVYPGQRLRVGFSADSRNLSSVLCYPYLQVYGASNQLEALRGPQTILKPGEATQSEWQLPETDGAPIAKVGIAITGLESTAEGIVYLDYLTWEGEPQVEFKRPSSGGTMWKRAWVSGTDVTDPYAKEAYRVIQNMGTGLLIQGSRQWKNYSVSATIKPHMLMAGGIAARVQGMRRYYALLLVNGGKVRLLKALDSETVLGELNFPWQTETNYLLRLDVHETRLVASVDGQVLFDLHDDIQPLSSGAIALVCTEGRLATESVSVSSL